MVLENTQYNYEEMKIGKILISIINVFGDRGLPLDLVDQEFINYCGYPIPYKEFGYVSLRDLISTLPDIYLVKDCHNNDILIQQSTKSIHIKQLIMKQKKMPSYKRNIESRQHQNINFNKRQKKINGMNDLPQGSFIHSSTNSVEFNGYDRYELFQKLESMLPLFYKHQALGDDFFLDIADNKLGYYVPENGPRECGLCISGQTIAGLTEKVKMSVHLAPRVVVMIGFQDLIQNRNVNSMIYDLRQLIQELKKKKSRVTLVTLIPSPKLPNMAKLRIRMDIFNKAILDYSCESDLLCNVIDMNAIFQREAESFWREHDRFMKVAKNDNYKVFSDYGRKIFLSTLKACLKEQLEAGH